MNFFRYWLMLLIALPLPTQATVVITPDAGDSPLVIRGWLDDAGDFTGQLRLTARHEPPDEDGDVNFLWLASDLTRGDGSRALSRRNVTLAGQPVLQPGVPKDFPVTVTGITEPGTYRGTLELLPAGAARSEALAIDLEVIARARPSLTPLASAETLRVDLVNCQSAINCWLAARLLPQSAFLETWPLQFENPQAVEASLVSSAVVVLGEKTRFPLSGDELTLPKEVQSFPAGGINAVPVTLNRTALPPDHYTGQLHFLLEGTRDKLTVPVDLNVRTGPFWPLIVILAGIILGRLVKYMQERGGPQADKLVEVNRMALRLRSVPAADRHLLMPQLEAVRQRVYRHELDSVTEDLEVIEERLETLRQLRAIATDVEGREHEQQPRTVQNKLAEARQRVADGRDASDLIAALEDLDQELIAKGLPDKRVKHALKTAAAKLGKGKGYPDLRAGTARLGRGLQDLLFALSGLSNELRAEATLWLVRPLLYFVLLFGLVAVGLNTLYVSAGQTFGAAPFADYLGLLLWGLSADVAGRTLSNLQGTK